MSWVNVGEVFYVLRRIYGDEDAAGAVRDMRREIHCELPDENRVLEAARIKAEHRLSYADAFAAATAVAHDAELWTGDPELLIADADWRWLDLR
jgi:predicted nucleic acid-binding protein